MRKDIRKIIIAVFVIILLLSSMLVANAEKNNTKIEDLENIQENDDLETLNQAPKLLIKESQPSKKYAVIMVGRYFGGWQLGLYGFNLTELYNDIQDHYRWYLNDAARMYKMLQDTYGYDNDSIYLLLKPLPEVVWIPGLGIRTFEIPDCFNTDWIDYRDNLEDNLKIVLEKFEPDGEHALGENDQLFFCFIDHGGNENVNYCYTIDGDYTNEFISPDSHDNSNWKYEDNAYDIYESGNDFYHNTYTKACFNEIQNGWSDALVLTLNEPKTIKGFRISAKSYKDLKGNQIHLDEMKVYLYDEYDNVVDISTFTNWPDGKYKYAEFEGEEKIVKKVKIRFHENDTDDWGFIINRALVYDFNFWEVDSHGEVGDTFFGCPWDSIPDALRGIFGYDVERLYDYELNWYTYRIEAKIIFALQPCNSGGFVRELGSVTHDGERIICTASRGFEFADEWIGPFRKALDKIDEDDDGIPDADLYLQDGNISIFEAYIYAAKYVNATFAGKQHPLLDDYNSDPVEDGRYVIAHHYSETNYFNPSDPEKDGYLAANTYL